MTLDEVWAEIQTAKDTYNRARQFLAGINAQKAA